MINEESTSEINTENQNYLIEKNSEEWKFVEFHLKSSIPSEIQINKIISVINTLTYNNFEFLSSNQLWAYGWYNLKGEDYEEKMKEMRTKTFDIPKTGVNFKVGAIFDHNSPTEVESAYILCKIIIGKSFCRLRQNGEKETPPEELDPPYQSYMYCSPEQSARSQKMSWSLTKPYSYYIKDRSCIEPLYAVFFTHIDSFITNMQSKYMCFECKVKEAEFYCPSCVNYFCKDCQNNIHFDNATDIKTKGIFYHGKPIKIDNIYTTRPGNCAIHPNRESVYYCNECKKAICGYCRFKGPHSKGFQSQHQLQDIYVALENIKNSNQNKAYENKKNNSYNTTKKIGEKIKNICDNMNNNQTDIETTFKEHRDKMELAAGKAKSEVFEYIANLREIKRNLNYYNNYFNEREKYLLEQKNYPELSFIWAIHQEIINEYLNNYEELKKKRFEHLIDNLKADFPVIKINNESYEFNKDKIQTEIVNKRNILKNDIFKQEQKAENYTILEKTKNLILEIKKKKGEANKQASSSQRTISQNSDNRKDDGNENV